MKTIEKECVLFPTAWNELPHSELFCQYPSFLPWTSSWYRLMLIVSS
jgi:hypothetical protein